MAKRKFGLALSVLLAAGTLLGACGSDNGEEATNEGNNSGGGESASEYSVAMVTDVGGVDDKSFNQAAWKGIQEFGEDNGLEKGDGGFDYLQSAGEEDYIPNLNALARRDFNLVFGVGFMMQDALDEIASQQKDTEFAIIDAVVEQPNTVSLLFKEHEGSYLAGVAAALMTESKKVGFVGGMENEVIHRFESGFVQGVEAVDPSIEVDIQYTGAFDKAELGKTTANRMYSSGVDIIFHAAGGTGNGVFSEAKERKSNDPDANVWVIGVDSDQYDEGAVGDVNVTLTSMLKRVDVAVKDISEKGMNGEFPGGEVITYGISEDGVALADSRGNIPEDIMAQIDEYQEKIASGEIEVKEYPEGKEPK
ncbi:basic membrane protein A [Bhargavaea ginsengi]|uniref:Basic membrane protein A n=1 Tax=Bhargavaea ginsengi TaxID=426757 RepID=A0A1H6SW62_9BACL|nr:BMP family protein [Bhargavaea ginsengi]SEI68280.1 basic membrane protein A [Bhargavaea ginsengi]